MKSVSSLSIFAGATMLAGCTGMAVDQLNKTEATGDEFTQRLALEYRGIANYESVEMYDWTDADYFAEKGLRAAQGEIVPPENLADWDLPQEALPELTDARSRLVAALDGGGRENYPVEAAVAQASFDCWVEQQEENAQPDDIAACRDQFFAAMETLEGVAAPTAPGGPGVYFVFFDWDEAEITEAGQAIVDQVIADYQASGTDEIAIVGHTDTSGADSYNLELGSRRAAAVRQALIAGGIPESQILTDTRGETQLLVETPDGVREPSNRRSEIRFQ
ncbi:MAG TPA: OmpA family protein [Alphaproteobacteria bacterium]|nr:OmpA family protein [Alphaproteobacteria bacterium]